jgi:restriction endonuclease S subunit
MWKTVKLGDVCDLSTGGTPSRAKSEYFDNGDVKWLVSGDINQREIFDCDGRITQEGLKTSNAKFLPLNSVLIALNGQGKTRGTVALLRTNATCNQSLVAISPKVENDLDTKYIFYVLGGMYDKIRKLTGDSGNDRRGLNMPIIRNIPFSYPPLAEQQRIVAKLDAVFAEIDDTIKITEDKSSNYTDLSSGIMRETLNNDLYKWETKNLSSISENLDSKRIPITKSKRAAGNVPYYGASGIVDYVEEYLFDDNLLLISEDGANLLMRTYPIAFSVSGQSWVNNHAHVLKFENLQLQEWVELYLNATNLSPYISGMAQPKLNQKKLNEIPIPCPDLEMLERLLNTVASAKKYVEKISLIESKKTNELKKLKSAILAQELKSEAA